MNTFFSPPSVSCNWFGLLPSGPPGGIVNVSPLGDWKVMFDFGPWPQDWFATQPELRGRLNPATLKSFKISFTPNASIQERRGSILLLSDLGLGRPMEMLVIIQAGYFRVAPSSSAWPYWPWPYWVNPVPPIPWPWGFWPSAPVVAPSMAEGVTEEELKVLRKMASEAGGAEGETPQRS